MCAGIERAMQFFTSPFLGNLSDSLGRKPVLLASLSMHLFSLLLVTAAPRVEHVLMYYIINGGFNVTLTMCNAIVTDLAVKGGEGDLARQYGKLGMAVGFSLVLGPAVGPSLSKLDIRFPLYVALGALIISVGLWYVWIDGGETLCTCICMCSMYMYMYIYTHIHIHIWNLYMDLYVYPAILLLTPPPSVSHVPPSSVGV
jgi:MFS family permease